MNWPDQLRAYADGPCAIPDDVLMQAAAQWEADMALLRQALDALTYHREQTRPIDLTDAAIAALRARLEKT